MRQVLFEAAGEGTKTLVVGAMIACLRPSDIEAIRAGRVDPRVPLVLRELDAFIARELGVHAHELEVTRILGGTPQSDAHDCGHAADARVRDWPFGLPDRAVAHLRRVFPRRDGDPYHTALYEVLGDGRATGPHLHCQVPHYPTPEWAVEVAMPTLADLPRGLL